MKVIRTRWVDTKAGKRYEYREKRDRGSSGLQLLIMSVLNQDWSTFDS